MDPNQQSVTAIAELAREGTAAELVEAKNGRQILLHRSGMSVTDVTSQHALYTVKPEYVKQTVSLQRTESLVNYVNRYKLTETTIFADIGADRLDAIIDYHGPSTGPAGNGADFLAHRANLQLHKDAAWVLWTKIDGQMMSQLDFARFIEENADDISIPSAGELHDAIRDLQAHRKVNFTKAVRTSTDSENFEFAVENEARTKGGLELPTRFTLRIPVYFGEPTIEINAFLRWRIEEDSLKLGIALNRPDFIRQEEFQRIAREVGDATERPVIYGTAK